MAESRRQRVVISGKASEWTEVLSSIIQGSVLLSILFLLYIDDIEDELEEPVEIVMNEQPAEQVNRKPALISIFVDDTKKTARTVKDTNDQKLMQGLIDRLGEWSKRWDLRFNVDKCKIFHAGRTNPRFQYNLYGQQL